MYIDGVMYYTAKEMASSCLLLSVILAFAIIGIVSIIKKFFDVGGR